MVIIICMAEHEMFVVSVTTDRNGNGNYAIEWNQEMATEWLWLQCVDSAIGR